MKITSFIPQALMPAISLLVFSFFTCETHAMASLAKHYVLFSNISGTITIDGKPVSNARVVRRVRKAHTTNDDLIDETTTDESGYFNMPVIRQKSIAAAIFPMAFGAPQEIHVYYEGMKHKIWSGGKTDPAENAEARGKPLVVSCDLASEEKMITVNGGTIFTKCDWDVEPDVEEPLMSPEEIEEFKRRNEEELKKQRETNNG